MPIYRINLEKERTEEEKRRLGIFQEGPASVFTESDSCKSRGLGKWIFKFGCAGNLSPTRVPLGFDLIDLCRDITLSYRYRHYHHDDTPKEDKEPPKHREAIACYVGAKQNDTCTDNEPFGLQYCRSN